MKMKQKGIATAAIAVVVIVVAAVCVGAFLVLRGRGGPGGLPIYPGSQEWEIPAVYKAKIPAGIDFAAYTVSDASVQDIVNWYKGQMTDWTLESEKPMPVVGMTIHMLTYRKGDDGAFICAMSGTGLPGTVYILGAGSWSVLKEI